MYYYDMTVKDKEWIHTFFMNPVSILIVFSLADGNCGGFLNIY